MPKISTYTKKKRNIDKIKAIQMHKQGFTLREIGDALGYSHEWARLAIKKLYTGKI